MDESKKKENTYNHAGVILDRMINLYGKSQTKFAEDVLGIKGPNISEARKTKQIPDVWFQKVIDRYNVTREELCRPPQKVGMSLEQNWIMPAETDSTDHAHDFSIEDMLADTRDVLESETVYRQALASNIRAFKQAVINEGKMKNTDEKIDQMMKQIEALTAIVLQSQAATETEKKRAGNAD